MIQHIVVNCYYKIIRLLIVEMIICPLNCIKHAVWVLFNMLNIYCSIEQISMQLMSQEIRLYIFVRQETK